MTERFNKWDAAEHLRTRGSYALACFNEGPGDGSVIRAALSEVARAGSMARLARESGT